MAMSDHEALLDLALCSSMRPHQVRNRGLDQGGLHKGGQVLGCFPMVAWSLLHLPASHSQQVPPTRLTVVSQLRAGDGHAVLHHALGQLGPQGVQQRVPVHAPELVGCALALVQVEALQRLA